jgi:transcriptional regulator
MTSELVMARLPGSAGWVLLRDVLVVDKRRLRDREEPHQPLMAVDGRPAGPVSSHQSLMGLTNTPSDLLPGTLELLILKALVSGAKHGYGIVEHLRLASDDVLNVGESALYPALQRLLLGGCVKAEWGASENNRRARFYTLTAAGRRQLAAERDQFDRMVGVIQQVLRA